MTILILIIHEMKTTKSKVHWLFPPSILLRPKNHPIINRNPWEKTTLQTPQNTYIAINCWLHKVTNLVAYCNEWFPSLLCICRCFHCQGRRGSRDYSWIGSLQYPGHYRPMRFICWTGKSLLWWTFYWQYPHPLII